MLSEPPLVGREEELDRLTRLIEEVKDGTGRLFFISGEGGIGKSRLANELQKVASGQGFKVLVGNCVPSSRIAYMPFIEAFTGFVEEEHQEKSGKSSRFITSAKKAAPDLMEAIPIIGGVLKGAGVFYNEYHMQGEGSEVDDKQMLFATLKLLSSETEKRPILLQIDDLQWADSPSVGMLHFLARNCKGMRLFILGIYRPEDILLDRKVGGNPFLDSLRIMRREGLCDELTLRPMTEGEVGQMINGLLGRPARSMTVNRIFKESGGKPLFTVEILRQMEKDGTLNCTSGDISIVDDKETEIPTSVKEVILRRIERLSKDERRTLEYASVVGRNFDPQLLAEALKMDTLTLLESLEHLHDDHQLVKEVEGGYSFEEDKVLKVTYDSISKLRRKEVHKVIGALLEARLPDDSLLPDLARHFNYAGDVQKAVKYSMSAGQFCLDRHSVAEALVYYGLAVDLTTKNQDLMSERSKALEGLADCYVQRDKARADMMYEQCLMSCTDPQDRSRLFRKQAECWLPNSLGKGDDAKAASLLDKAEQNAAMNAHEEGEIAFLRGMICHINGGSEEMKGHFDHARRAFFSAGERSMLADLIFTEVLIAIEMADMGAVTERMKELREINKGIDSNRTDAEIMLCEGAIHCMRGEVDLCLSDLDRATKVACQFGDHKLMSSIMTWRGQSELEAKRYEAAKGNLTEASDYARELDDDYDAAVLSFHIAVCCMRAGMFQEADGIINDLMDKGKGYKGNLGLTLTSLGLVGKTMNALLSGKQEKGPETTSMPLTLQEGRCRVPAFNEAFILRELADVLRSSGRIREAGPLEERVRDLHRSFGRV